MRPEWYKIKREIECKYMCVFEACGCDKAFMLFDLIASLTPNERDLLRLSLPDCSPPCEGGTGDVKPPPGGGGGAGGGGGGNSDPDCTAALSEYFCTTERLKKLDTLFAVLEVVKKITDNEDVAKFSSLISGIKLFCSAPTLLGEGAKRAMVQICSDYNSVIGAVKTVGDLFAAIGPPGVAAKEFFDEMFDGSSAGGKILKECCDAANSTASGGTVNAVVTKPVRVVPQGLGQTRSNQVIYMMQKRR